MAFKKVGLILGTEGVFREVAQIKIDQPFNLLELKQFNQIYPQDWVLIYTHNISFFSLEKELEFNDKNNDFYETVEKELEPHHLLFAIYNPKLGNFVFKYESSLFTGEYDAFGNYLKNVILPSPEFHEPLCKGLTICFHLDFLLNYK